MKNYKITLVLVAALGLGGCATGGTKQTVGTVVGGVTGALVGSQFGGGAGQIVGTALGTLGGAVVGGMVGKSMDDTDKHSK